MFWIFANKIMVDQTKLENVIFGSLQNVFIVWHFTEWLIIWKKKQQLNNEIYFLCRIKECQESRTDEPGLQYTDVAYYIIKGSKTMKKTDIHDWCRIRKTDNTAAELSRNRQRALLDLDHPLNRLRWRTKSEELNSLSSPFSWKTFWNARSLISSGLIWHSFKMGDNKTSRFSF